MVPVTSSPSVIFTSTGVSCSINCLRYLASSNVASGARADLPCCAVLVLLTLFGGAFRADRNSRVGRAAAHRFPIIAVARRYPQLAGFHAHFKAVERVLGERNLVGVEAEHVLGAQLRQDVGEGLIELCAGVGIERAAARALRHEFERVLAAGVAAGVVRDGQDDDGVEDRKST